MSPLAELIARVVRARSRLELIVAIGERADAPPAGITLDVIERVRAAWRAEPEDLGRERHAVLAVLDIVVATVAATTATTTTAEPAPRAPLAPPDVNIALRVMRERGFLNVVNGQFSTTIQAVAAMVDDYGRRLLAEIGALVVDDPAVLEAAGVALIAEYERRRGS